MKSRMIWNDIARNKAVALMLLLFVSAAAMLLSSAAVLGANLSGSIDRLMQDARTPHFMQMHTGELELDRLEAFAAEQAQVSQFQVVRFLNMDNDSIAAMIGVTPNYLTGIFQSHLGISLHRYVTNIRIDRARQMLLKSDLNITEVARQTGFSGIHVFSKTFKNLIGVSPSQFLDEMVSREQIEENMSECAEGF